VSSFRSNWVRTLALISAVLLLLTAAGCDGEPKDSTSTGTIRPFSGSWYAHSISLEVDRSGHATIAWRIGLLCSEAPPPCDRLEGDTLKIGGEAQLTISEVEGQVAHGRVLVTTDESSLPTGDVQLRLDADRDFLFVSPWAGGELKLCGPDAATEDCGA
jgi:hypothetical protein